MHTRVEISGWSTAPPTANSGVNRVGGRLYNYLVRVEAVISDWRSALTRLWFYARRVFALQPNTNTAKNCTVNIQKPVQVLKYLPTKVGGVKLFKKP